MVDFTSRLAGLDAAIDDHLRDAALLRPTDGGPDVAVRVALEYPTEVERLELVGVSRDRPWVEISKLSAPRLAKGDLVLLGPASPYNGWRIAERPMAPGDGRHWRAEVESMGPVA